MTINDVAKVAGVSKSTVSRYLNNGYVSDENRERIRIAIETTGYKTNVFARGLKTNRSYLIAIIVPRLDSFTAMQTLTGMNMTLSQHGYQMVVVPKNTIEEDEITYLRRISTQGYDGIIVMAHAITDDHVRIANTSQTPILFTGQEHLEASTVTLDDYAMGARVADYVNSLAVSNVLYLSVSESDYAVGVKRKNGFLEHLNAPVRTLVSGFRQSDSYDVMQRESSTLNFDIIVGATDNIALGALRYLNSTKPRVPGNVKVVGIGNYELSHLISPSLTTLNVDYQAFGRNAANRMLASLNPDYSYELEPISFDMIERETTQ